MGNAFVASMLSPLGHVGEIASGAAGGIRATGEGLSNTYRRERVRIAESDAHARRETEEDWMAPLDPGEEALSTLKGPKELADDVTLLEALETLPSRSWGALLQARDDVSQGLDTASSSLREDVRRIERNVSYNAHRYAEQTRGIPVLGSVARGGLQVIDTGTQLASGVVLGAADMGHSLASSALHPVETAEGVATLASHVPGVSQALHTPAALLEMARGGSFTESMRRDWEEDKRFMGHVGHALAEPFREAHRSGHTAEGVGRGLFELATLFGPAALAMHARSSASRAAGVVEGARVATTGADAARATEAARAAESARVAAEAERLAQASHMHAPPRTVMEMPAVDPAAAARGQLPRDWSAARVGTARLPGEAGQFPVFDPAARGAPPNVSSGGRIQGTQGAQLPAAPVTAPALTSAPTEAAPRVVTREYGAAPQHPPTLETPSPFAPTVPVEAVPRRIPTRPYGPDTPPKVVTREYGAAPQHPPTLETPVAAVEQAPSVRPRQLAGNQMSLGDVLAALAATDETLVVEMAHGSGLTVREFLANNGVTKPYLLEFADEIDLAHPRL